MSKKMTYVTYVIVKWTLMKYDTILRGKEVFEKRWFMLKEYYEDIQSNMFYEDICIEYSRGHCNTIHVILFLHSNF